MAAKSLSPSDKQMRPIFIGGPDRCGKTTLQAFLSSHPNIAIPAVGSNLWSYFYDQYGDLHSQANFERCLDALQGDTPAEPLIRDLLERAVRRLRLLCAALLQRSYPRLTQPPLNLETDELLGGVVAGLLTALRTIRPQTVRQSFGRAMK